MRVKQYWSNIKTKANTLFMMMMEAERYADDYKDNTFDTYTFDFCDFGGCRCNNLW